MKVLLIKNTSIFDGIDSNLLTKIDVLVEGNAVKEIGINIAVNKDTLIIDGSKLTVIPGLIDCHTHFRSWMSPLFFQFGVTTIRDVGSDPDWIISLREKEKNGDNSLPRIVTYGPLLDGIPAVWGTKWKGSIELDSLDQAKRITTSLIKKGVDGFKVYTRLPKDCIEEVINIAHAHNLPVAGDLRIVSAWEAAKMGITSIEHTNGILYPIPDDKLQGYIDLLLQNNIYLDPTFMVQHISAFIQTEGNKNYPNLNLVPQEEKEYWLNWQTKSWHKNVKKPYYKVRQKREIYKAQFVAAFHEAGGKIVAGSDTPNPFVIPGFSLHQEIKKMVEIGLSPVDALKTATSVAAQLLRKNDIGSIKKGNLADMILLSGNPIQSISNLDNVSMVIKNGEIVYTKSILL